MPTTVVVMAFRISIWSRFYFLSSWFFIDYMRIRMYSHEWSTVQHSVKFPILPSHKILNYASRTQCDLFETSERSNFSHWSARKYSVCWKMPPPQSSQSLGSSSLARRLGHIWNAIRFHLLWNCANKSMKIEKRETFYISSLSKLSPVINQSRMHEFNTFICMRSVPSPIESSGSNWEWAQVLPCAYPNPRRTTERRTQKHEIQRLCKLPLRQLHSSVSEKLGQIVVLIFAVLFLLHWPLLMAHAFLVMRISVFPFYFFSSFTARCSPFRCLQIFKSCSTVAVVVVAAAIPISINLSVADSIKC